MDRQEFLDKAWPYVKEYMDWYLDPDLNDMVLEIAMDRGITFDEAVRQELFNPDDDSAWWDPEVGIVFTGWYEDENLFPLFEEMLDSEGDSFESSGSLVDLVDMAKKYAEEKLNSDTIEECGEISQMEEEVKTPETRLVEVKLKSPSDFAMEFEKVKADFEDFGPDGFYAVPFSTFKREYPMFTEEIIKTFLKDMEILTPKELSDPAVYEEYWQTGELITPEDWPALLDGAERLLTFRKDKGIQWEKIYKSHYKSYDESLTENLKTPSEAYKLFTACINRFFPDEEKIREAARQVYEIFKGDPAVEDAWLKWNDFSKEED